jgi:lipopolysaccharide assembly outer membrane protein LptD (OstA)
MNRRTLFTLIAAFGVSVQAAWAASPKPAQTAPVPAASGRSASARPSPSKPGPTKPAPSSPPGFSFADWHVKTNQLDTNWQSGNFTTPGAVVLTRPGSDIRADRSNGNFKQKSAKLSGHVVLHDSNGVLTNFAGQSGPHVPATLMCDNLTIDGKTKTYVATGKVYFKQAASEVRSDRAVMNGLTHDIHLYGNVQLTQ